jgi:hypothetical protein
MPIKIVPKEDKKTYDGNKKMRSAAVRKDYDA